MAFAQSFATAFLNGLTGQIQEARKEGREEVSRKKRIAEQAGLPQYLKRQKNFNSYMGIAKTLIEDYGANRDLVKVLATDPEKLLGANKYIEDFKAKYDGRNLTPTRINGFLGSLRLATPDVDADGKPLSLKEVVERTAGLAVANTDIEAEKADPGKMEDNFLFSLFNFNSEDRTKQKLREQKVGGKFNYYDLYRMGLEGDPTSDTVLGGFDYSFLPQELSTTQIRSIEDAFEDNVNELMSVRLEELTSINMGKITDKDEKKKINDERLLLEKLIDNYGTVASFTKQANELYGAGYYKNVIMTEGNVKGILRNVRSLTPSMKINVVKELLADPRAVEQFGEEELEGILAELGGQPENTLEKPIGNNTLKNEENNNKNLGTEMKEADGEKSKDDNSPSQKVINVPSEDALKELLAPEQGMKEFIENFTEFLEMYTEDKLPQKLPSEYMLPKGQGNRRVREKWRFVLGQYYNDDGTRKVVEPVTKKSRRRSRR